MTHDPLCPNYRHVDGCLCCEVSAPCIHCALIAKARAESVDRAIIHLVLHGFHADRPEWGQRFREAIVR